MSPATDLAWLPPVLVRPGFRSTHMAQSLQFRFQRLPVRTVVPSLRLFLRRQGLAQLLKLSGLGQEQQGPLPGNLLGQFRPLMSCLHQ